MDKRTILLLVLEAAVACGSGQPNVLLLVVDDLRPVLGCYGDPVAVTPNIDALARDATVFTRAYAQQALCGPSRTSFLTSRRPDTTRLYDVHSYWRRHAGNFTTLPQYFRDHGYHTVSAGKIFHPGIVSNHSDDQPYSWSEAPYHPPTQAHKQDPVCLGSDGSLHTNIYCPVQVEEQPGGSLPDIQTTRHSIAWLREWAGRAPQPSQPPPQQPNPTATQQPNPTATQQPFFLAVGFHKPHIPLKFPKQFLDLYPIQSVPLAPNRGLPTGLPPVAWNPWNDLRWREDIAALNVSFPYGPMPDEYARYIRQGYYAATSYTDSLIGDLLTTLDHLFPDTIVAFIGDHGWSLGEHQEWSKFSNFEVSTRVPFIIRNWRRTQTDAPQAHAGSPRPHPDTAHSHSDATSPSPSTLSTSTGTSDSRRLSQYPQNPSHPQYPANDHSSTRTGCESLPQDAAKKSAAGRRVEYSGLVELVDLFPTLVDLAGLPALPSCPKDSRQVKVCTEGMSLTHLMHPRQGEGSKGTPNSDTRHGNSNKKTNSWDVMINELLINTAKPSQANEVSWSEEIRLLTETNINHRDHIAGEFKLWSKKTKPETRLKQQKSTKILLEVQKPLNLPQGTEKRAAFSQYPRPGATPSQHPDSDQPHTRDTTVMGYSIRTDRFRYTAWLRFDNKTYRPDWNSMIAEELYDHKIDPSEDHNVVGKWLYRGHKKAVYSMLVRGWRRAGKHS